VVFEKCALVALIKSSVCRPRRSVMAHPQVEDGYA